MDSFGLGLGPRKGSHEHGNEPLSLSTNVRSLSFSRMARLHGTGKLVTRVSTSDATWRVQITIITSNTEKIRKMSSR
jgi:hypothetical protein